MGGKKEKRTEMDDAHNLQRCNDNASNVDEVSASINNAHRLQAIVIIINYPSLPFHTGWVFWLCPRMVLHV